MFSRPFAPRTGRCARVPDALAVLVAFVLFAPPAGAADLKPGPQGPLEPAAVVNRLRQQEHRVPMTAKDSNQHLMQAQLTLPDGNGPWPGVVITHGSPRQPADRAKRDLMPATALWFAEQGFAVLNLTRRGYGQSEGGYVEGFGKCESPNYLAAGTTTARDLAAAVQYLKTQSFVDPKRIVVAGISAGGWGVVALAAQNPEGVVLGLNFAGGRGSRVEGQVCQPEAMFDALAQWGRTAKTPTYWIYAENDLYWGPELPKKMFQAYRAGGAPAEFWGTPAYPYHRDGHLQFRHNRGSDAWGAKLAEFLKQFPGLAR